VKPLLPKRTRHVLSGGNLKGAVAFGSVLRGVRPRHDSQSRKRKRLPVTICAAALCRNEGKEVVLAVADRMITYGDIEYETQNATKLAGFSPAHAVCLGSGPSEVFFSIARKTHLAVIRDQITGVAEVARLFAENLAILKRSRAEQDYLFPLGLDLNSLMTKQDELSQELVLALTDQLQQHEEPELEELSVIVAGVEPSEPHEPHIYHVRYPGESECLDGCGFCAIGSGGRQFETIFMALGYDRFWPLTNALLPMYSAKRRAEVSPGVGPKTDMFILDGDGLHEFSPAAIGNEGLLKKFYGDLEGTVKNKLNELNAAVVRENVSSATQCVPWTSFGSSTVPPPAP
jgi:hypothetical protein